MAERHHDGQGEDETDDCTMIATEVDIKEMKAHKEGLILKKRLADTSQQTRFKRKIKELEGEIKDLVDGEKKGVRKDWRQHYHVSVSVGRNTYTTTQVKFQHDGCRLKPSVYGSIAKVKHARVLIISNEFAEDKSKTQKKSKVRHGCRLDYNKAVQVFVNQFGYENFIETVVKPGSDLLKRLNEAGDESKIGMVDRNSMHSISWTLKQMKILVEAAVMIPFDGDAIIIIIGTHGHSEGDRTILYGEDSKADYADNFLNQLHDRNCHDSVKGKLKLFVVQACRGNEQLQYNEIDDNETEILVPESEPGDGGDSLQESETQDINEVAQSSFNESQDTTTEGDIDESGELGAISNTEQSTSACLNVLLDGSTNQPQHTAVQCSEQDEKKIQELYSTEPSNDSTGVVESSQGGVISGVQELSIAQRETNSTLEDTAERSPSATMLDAAGDTGYAPSSPDGKETTQLGVSGDAATSNSNLIAQETVSPIMAPLSDLQNATACSNERGETAQDLHRSADESTPTVNVGAEASSSIANPDDFSSVDTEKPPSMIVPAPSLSQYIPDVLLPISCPKHCIVLYSTPFPCLSSRLTGSGCDEGSVVLQTFLAHLEECMKQHGDNGVPLLQLITAVTRVAVVDELEMPEVVHKLVRLPVFFRNQ